MNKSSKNIIISVVVTASVAFGSAGFYFNHSKQEQAANTIQTYQKQMVEQESKQELVQKSLDNMLKNAKKDGDTYTFINNSKYTFKFVQLHWMEYTKDGQAVFQSDSASNPVNNIKPGDTFSIKVHMASSIGKLADHYETKGLFGSVN